MTGELRVQTSFDGPLNFSSGVFWMSFDSRNQYWVAANGLDWESMAIGAVAGSGFDLPLMAASTSYDGEYRRGAVQSRSAFLEGTYDIIPDELKLIAGARYNDDRTSSIDDDLGRRRTSPAEWPCAGRNAKLHGERWRPGARMRWLAGTSSACRRA